MKNFKDTPNTDKTSVQKSGLFVKEDLTFRIIEILDKEKEINRALQHVCDAIAANCIVKNAVSVRILFHNQVFQSPHFEETTVIVKHDFQLPDQNKGLVELFL